MGAALTPNETEVLALLRGANSPMTAYQLLGRMQGKGGAVAPPTVYRALKGLEEAGVVHRIETLRAWTMVTSPVPGVVAICDDCGSVRSVEAPSLFESLHQRLAAEGFAEARQTIEVHAAAAIARGARHEGPPPVRRGPAADAGPWSLRHPVGRALAGGGLTWLCASAT